MRVVKKIFNCRKIIEKIKKENKIVGFVPTMGYFHDGHLELMKRAKKKCDFVVVSIFVNPLQFGPKEDFKKYPRDLKRDLKLAKNVGVDLIFAPTDKEMYKENFSTSVEVVGNLTSRLEGYFRPGHFKGVTIVVAKLFEIVKPDYAFFGEKDYQQLLIIKKMVDDLNMNIKIIPVPIVREKDGLAMSSRNVYLSKDERKKALSLYRSLKFAKNLIKNGEKNVKIIKKKMEKIIEGEIDYIAICNSKNLEDVREVKGEIIIALAVRIGKTRLIDNILIRR